METLEAPSVDPLSQNHAMNPFSPAFVPSFSEESRQSQRRAVQGSNTKQTEIISPISRRAGSLLQQLSSLDLQDPMETSQALAMYRQSVNTVDLATSPRKMPIGSLVLLKGPPEWGVVKISNIPYSITKQEIFQFLGRQAKLITADNGCPIHIIMERSTAKTMDCYAEFQTPDDARNTVSRINRIYETGRAPRLGNRHVEVELSHQNELLKDLFPRAKCIAWIKGMPFEIDNTDPYCSGFSGFFTSEEIILAIRHAEIPHRSPFCDKCPQRTFESTISTLHKFPWYAPHLYTVNDRNQLFELANRHIKSLVARIKKQNTVGLDQKLLLDLLQAGLKCPAFNERQKYTLCVNSEITPEISKISELSKWFPFDTLGRMPNFHEDIHVYYAILISQGTDQDLGNNGVCNMFPLDHPSLRSPYGRVWFEWPQAVSDLTFEQAMKYEMILLCRLVLTGWNNDDTHSAPIIRRASGVSSFPKAAGSRRNLSLSSIQEDQTLVGPFLPAHAHPSPSRRASESASLGGVFGANNSASPWGQKLLLDPPTRERPAFRGHRITQSSPMCLPSPTTNPWGQERSD
ncbi:hypothetical protein BJY04DRAFT_215750 [Aspergillus karnatakaensis]|uniref:uncharacterized protein n=1 Tax=Aspergillus karnatakaensis TaxID=1810916 RepID=UPI003CCE3FEB